MRKFFKTNLFKSLMITLTTAFDVEFEVTDEFLEELNEKILSRKKQEVS